MEGEWCKAAERGAALVGINKLLENDAWGKRDAEGTGHAASLSPHCHVKPEDGEHKTAVLVLGSFHRVEAVSESHGRSQDPDGHIGLPQLRMGAGREMWGADQPRAMARGAKHHAEQQQQMMRSGPGILARSGCSGVPISSSSQTLSPRQKIPPLTPCLPKGRRAVSQGWGAALGGMPVLGARQSEGLGAGFSTRWERSPWAQGAMPCGTQQELSSCQGAPGAESLGRTEGQIFVCSASAVKDRLFRSLRNIPLLLRCSWENLVQHMQAINMISEKRKKIPTPKTKQSPN